MCLSTHSLRVAEFGLILTDGGRRWFPCLVYVKTPNIPHNTSVVVLRNQLSKLNREAPIDPTPLQNCQTPPRFVQTTAFGAISHHHDLDWSTSKYSISTIPYYKWSAPCITLRECQKTIGKHLLNKMVCLNNVSLWNDGKVQWESS